jgi:hypothetical protein
MTPRHSVGNAETSPGTAGDELAPNAEPSDVNSLSAEESEAAFEAPAVLRMLWADPQYMPEHLALWSLKRFGPRASSAVEKLRGSHPDADAAELNRVVVERQTRISMTEGAFVGGPFIVLIPIAFCAALLAQAQMALELAALAGFSPTDQMRAADLLVLQGAYASTPEASAALEKVARAPERVEGGKLPRGSRMSMIRRMAYMLGVITQSEEKQSRLRSTLRISLFVVVVLIGFVLPLIWVPLMGLAFRKSGTQMGERATEFYAHGRSSDAGVTVRKAETVRIGMAAGLIRMTLLILLPLAVAVIALLAGADIGIGEWGSSGALLLAVSVLATLAWLLSRWWRRRRRVAGEPSGRPASAPPVG